MDQRLRRRVMWQTFHRNKPVGFLDYINIIFALANIGLPVLTDSCTFEVTYPTSTQSLPYYF